VTMVELEAEGCEVLRSDGSVTPAWDDGMVERQARLSSLSECGVH
jgi:hypothetical protein